MVSLLLLTQPLPKVISELPKVLEAAGKYTSSRLYIHWDSYPSGAVSSESFHDYHSGIVSNIYQTSSIVNPRLDVRVLLHGFKFMKETFLNSLHIDNFLIDHQNVEYLSNIEQKYGKVCKRSDTVFLLGNHSTSTSDHTIPDYGHSEAVGEVVIGGTFDNIHTGHKVLLSESIMRAKHRLTIGMADGPLLAKKVLRDLIAPCEQRIKALREFLNEIDSSIEYNLVPITEPMGPTSWDPSLQLIVVSEETEKTVDYINNHRKINGLNLLNKYVIKLAEDPSRSEGEEVKHSSSSIRRRLLGTRLNSVKPNENIPSYPYIIGLTGGSASGKSHIASYLAKLGAGIIDCDAMGHKAYIKGSQCLKKLTSVFGNSILSDCGEIDRKTLGSIVFRSPDQMKLLNSIVWPEIKTMVLEEIDSFRKMGIDVVVLDAAVLIAAGWHESCHETWVCFVQRDEAVRRIMERDKKSERDAEDRISRQLPNTETLKYANIAFCSQFQYEFTQSQVRKAWNILKSENKIKGTDAHL